jgi:hypothetical protein
MLLALPAINALVAAMLGIRPLVEVVDSTKIPSFLHRSAALPKPNLVANFQAEWPISGGRKISSPHSSPTEGRFWHGSCLNPAIPH